MKYKNGAGNCLKIKTFVTQRNSVRETETYLLVAIATSAFKGIKEIIADLLNIHFFESFLFAYLKPCRKKIIHSDLAENSQ